MRSYFTLEDVMNDPSVVQVTPWYDAPEQVTIFDRNVGERTLDIGWANELNTNQTYATTENYDTKMIAMQSAFLNRKLITTLGYRTDDIEQIAYEREFLEEESLIDPTDTYYTGVFVDRDTIGTQVETSAITRNYGVIYHVNDSLSLFYNKASNVSPGDPDRTVLPDGSISKPSDGKSEDIGLKFYLMDKKLTGSLSYFATDSIQEVTGYNNTALVNFRDDVRDYLTLPYVVSEDVTLDPLMTEGEWDADMAAKGYFVNWNGRYQDTASHGIELSLNANINDNWSVRFTASKKTRLTTNKNAELIEHLGFVFDEENTDFPPEFNLVKEGSTFVDNNTYTLNSDFRDSLTDGFMLDMLSYLEMRPEFDPASTTLFRGNPKRFSDHLGRFQENAINRDRISSHRSWGLRPYNASIQTRYKFTEGKLKGFTTGGGLSWKVGAVSGYGADYSEWEGPDQWRNDIFFRYSWNNNGDVLAGKWTAQLNIQNILDEDDFVIVRPRYDVDGNVITDALLPNDWGIYAARLDLPTGRTWRFNMSYEF